MISEDAAVPLTRVLDTVQAELAELGTLVERVQSAISPLLLQAAADGGAAPREAQQLDFVTQRLHATALFLDLLTRQLDARWSVDPGLAACGVTLSDLSRRLACRDDRLEPLSDDSDGELELFG